METEEFDELMEDAIEMRRKGQPREAALKILRHADRVDQSQKAEALECLVEACDQAGAPRDAVRYGYSLREVKPDAPILEKVLDSQQPLSLGDEVKYYNGLLSGEVRDVICPGRYKVFFPITGDTIEVWEDEIIRIQE